MKHPKDTLNSITLSKLEWIALLACLQELLDGVLTGLPLLCPNEGICRNWFVIAKRSGWSDDVAYKAFDIIIRTGARWKHSQYPGRCDPFPVPKVPIDGYLSYGYMWIGANRDLRIDLMRYTIKRMRDKIRRMK